MLFVSYLEGREVNLWSLGDKCSVPTGPSSLYMDNLSWFDLIVRGLV